MAHALNASQRQGNGRPHLFLLLLAVAAWSSSLLYLVVRSRLPVPVDLARVDGVHVYVGFAALIFFGGMLAKRHLPSLLLFLYVAIFATGGLLVLPIPEVVRSKLVVAHLLAAVWAVPVTTRFLWQSREVALSVIARAGRGAWRSWAAAALVILPTPIFLLVPRALGPLSQAGSGQIWSATALNGVFLDHLEQDPTGQGMIAGGDGLYQETSGRWLQVAFPPELVLGLAVVADPPAVYVGTSTGLYVSQRPSGPYQKLNFPSREVHGIAIDPADPDTVWASSRAGFWRSADQGKTWSSQSSGIQDPTGAWALTYSGKELFGTDALGVYRWNGSNWERVSNQRYVVSVDRSPDGSRLFASSMGEGVRVFEGQGWSAANEGLASHGSGAIHVVSVTAASDHAFAATMLDGVAVTRDGTQWEALGAGLPVGAVWRIAHGGPGQLLAATDSGLFSYPWSVTPPGPGWWALLAFSSVAASLGGMVALRWGEPPERRGHRRARPQRLQPQQS